MTSTAIITISKQLKLEELVIKHQEYSARFDDLHRVIQAELVLLSMNDSSYASREDFLKIIENELSKIQEAPSPPSFIAKKYEKPTTSDV